MMMRAMVPSRSQCCEREPIRSGFRAGLSGDEKGLTGLESGWRRDSGEQLRQRGLNKRPEQDTPIEASMTQRDRM